MANGKIRFGKQSGGQLTLVIPDGVTSTDLVLPESGTVASVSGAVTDNAIVRFDGTTGKVQNSGVVINDNNNVGIGTTLDNNTRRIGFTTASGGSSAIESATLGVTTQDLVFKTTYAIESEKMRITGQGNVLVTGGGVLGYGAGSGGTVTQLTSKSTAVTLNKPTGQITMNNSALAAGASVEFILNNTSIITYSIVTVNPVWNNSNYKTEILLNTTGAVIIRVTNTDSVSHDDSLVIRFSVLSGAVS